MLIFKKREKISGVKKFSYPGPGNHSKFNNNNNNNN
jgi:hypothetical protein